MQCSYCGDRYTDDQYSSEHKATGHKWIVNTDAEDPASDEDKKLGFVTVKEADCLNAAQLQKTCSVCGDTEEKVGAPATGHKIKDSTGKLVDPTELCKVNDKLVDAEGNKIYAFECENENCPVEVKVDARGNTKHFIKAVDHVMETVEEHINCEDTDDNKSYILEKCKNCDTVWTGADSEDGYKKTYVDEAGHDYNTVQTDGKTSVVVCIEDKGLNTQDKYLEYMRSVVDFTTYQANWQKYVAAWNNAYEITSKPNIPTQEENGNPVRVVFELGGNTLTMKINTVQSPSDKAFWDVSNELVFKNGELKVESTAAASFDVEDGAVLTMENVVFTTNNNAIRTEPSESGAGEINLTNTTIRTTGEYAVGTNAATGVKLTEESENKVIINITDSTITAGVEYNALTGAYTPVSDKDGTALFINVPSKVTVEGSTLVANHQSVMVRGGELEMSDSTVKLVKMDDTDDSLNMAWATGNDAPRAAMLLGNKNRTDSETAYQYKTTVILDNVKFDVDTADRTVVIASKYTASTLTEIAENEGLEKGEVPVMVYFDGGNCVNDKQIDFVDNYDKGTIQLIDCGNASGIY